MWTVTRSATQAVGQVLGLGEILRLQTGLMALGANRSRLRGTQGLEPNDLGGIATTVYVGLRRTMTRLASMLVALKQCRMRSIGEVLVPDFLVTRFADVIVRILGSTRSWERG